MTWEYHQRTGTLLRDGRFEGTGYSGKGAGRNNPDAESIAQTGPIPRGRWKIGSAYAHPHLGPCVMNLEPAEGADTHGRSLFRIHGDNARHAASEGCIILGPAIRRLIAHSGDTDLLVTA